MSNKVICNICNKNYASKSSLWNHNKKFHDLKKSENDLKISENIKSFNCRTCNKYYNNIQSRWSHEKICKKKVENNEIKKLQEHIIKLESEKKNIINNNNGIINNITINNFGEETVDKLTSKQIMELANMNINAYVHVIELLNFNKNLPENHSFCVTSLEGNYVNYLNTKTNQIEKMNKKDFMDKVLASAIKKIEDILFNIEFKTNENAIVNKEVYNKLQETSDKSTIMIGKHRKIYHKNINQLSYNKKKMILDKWKNLNIHEEDHEDSSSEFDPSEPYEYDLGIDPNEL